VVDGLHVADMNTPAARAQHLARSAAPGLQPHPNSDRNWYLIRTKPKCEKIARDNMPKIVDETLLPLATFRFRQQGRTVQRVGPVFPSYLFAYFSLGRAARQIRYTPGVHDVVRFGEWAPVVPAAVIEDLMERCSRGPAELSECRLSMGSPLKIIAGPFRDFDAVFDRYLNGNERVAVLLSVMSAERRAVLPADMVIPAASARGAGLALRGA
jgi:transcriptional antiterminator RfaH